jgi:hypothetical protein
MFAGMMAYEERFRRHSAKLETYGGDVGNIPKGVIRRRA